MFSKKITKRGVKVVRAIVGLLCIAVGGAFFIGNAKDGHPFVGLLFGTFFVICGILSFMNRKIKGIPNLLPGDFWYRRG